MGEFNGVPHYSQDNGNGFLYRNTLAENGNENWHFHKTVGSPQAVFWAFKSDCPSYNLVWYFWDSQQNQWSQFTGLTVTINIGIYNQLYE